MKYLDYIKQHSFIKFTLFCFFFAMYLILNFFTVRAYGPLNSDSANMVLEASAILDGNIFLSNWVLTGITFFTTDLPFFVLGVIFFGVSENAYFFASALMFSCFVAVIIGIAYSLLVNKRILLFGLLIICCPMAAEINLARVHTAVFIYMFIAYWMIHLIVSCSTPKIPRRYFFILVLSVLLGTAGDQIMVFESVLAIFIYLFFRWFKIGYNKRDIKCGISVLVGMIVGVILEKAILLGGADKNSYLESTKFIAIEDLIDKFLLYVKGSLSIFGADFGGMQIIGFETLRLFVCGILYFIGFLLIINVLFRLFKGILSPIEDLTVITILLSSLILILSTQMIDESGLRYMNFIRPAIILLLILYLDRTTSEVLYTSSEVGKRFFKLCVIFLITYTGLNFYNIKEISSKQTDSHQQLAEYLIDNGYKDITGYAQFWDASITTVFSKNEIHLRHILLDEHRANLMYWFCNLDWYQQDAHYIIINTTREDFTENQVRNAFGKPDRIDSFQEYLIYTYDRNLSLLLVNGLNDGKILPNEWSAFKPEDATFSPDELIVNPDGFIYGPYASIEPGTYTFVFSGENLNDIVYDVYSNSTGIIPHTELQRSNTYVSFQITIKESIKDIEFRIYNNTNSTMTIYALEKTLHH